MSSRTPLLEVSKLQSGYGFLKVLWDISLYVDEGEFVALVGPNGSGKTTLLRTLTGYIPVWSGEASIGGKSIASLPPHQIARDGVGFISESLNLFTQMSVRENLLMGAYAINEPNKTGRLLEFVYELFPILREREKQLAGTLSGGERKMLAIARGLMLDPSLLLVDEPSLGLAPQTTIVVFDALKTLQKAGVTILLVEQNVSSTLHITDRAYVVEQGQIVLEGRSQDLLTNSYVRKAYLGV